MSTQRTLDQRIRDDAIIAGLVRDLALAKATIGDLQAKLQIAQSDPRVTKHKSSDSHVADNSDDPPMRSDIYPHEAHEHKPEVHDRTDYRDSLSAEGQKFHETHHNIEEFGRTREADDLEGSGRLPSNRSAKGVQPAKHVEQSPDETAPNYFKYLQHHDPDKLSRIGEKGGHNSHKNDDKRSRSRSHDEDDDARPKKHQKIQA